VIIILQGNVVTQTVFSGPTVRPPVVNFAQCLGVKIYENLVESSQRYCNKRVRSFWPHNRYVRECKTIARALASNITRSSAIAVIADGTA